MRSYVLESIQQLIIRTSLAPLTFLYRAYYFLSIAVATFLLRRVDGVMSIYLRRGAGKGDIVYGLSDIDLLIIVNGEGDIDE